MEERNISIGNLNINYKIAGEGPAILVLHGWGGSSDSWIRVQKLLEMAGFKVVIPDFPGFGKSVTPPVPWGIKEYTDFVVKFSENLNLQSFFLLGHSFGGRIAIKLAADYSEKIKSLILCDSAGIKPKPSIKTRIIFEISRIGNAIFSPKHLIRFRDWARNMFYISLRNKDYIKAKGVMRETIIKVLEEDLLPDLGKIKTKTLIVWGSVDKMVPLKYTSVFKEKIEGARIEIMPKIGHSPHLEAPEKLAEIIIKFLKEI